MFHWPRLKSILCPGFISQGFPSQRLEVITCLLTAWWSHHRTSREFGLGITVPPVNPSCLVRNIARWSGIAYSTRRAWLILQLIFIPEDLSPICHWGTHLGLYAPQGSRKLRKWSRRSKSVLQPLIRTSKVRYSRSIREVNSSRVTSSLLRKWTRLPTHAYEIGALTFEVTDNYGSNGVRPCGAYGPWLWRVAHFRIGGRLLQGIECGIDSGLLCAGKPDAGRGRSAPGCGQGAGGLWHAHGSPQSVWPVW